MSEYNIEDYEGGEEEEIVRLWNEVLFRDPIDISTFERKVLLDPNFDASGLKLARIKGEIVGFIVTIKRKYPLFYEGLNERIGWILAMGVKNEHKKKGVGSKLLEEGIKYLANNGAKEVWYSTYVPNYFFPGVDEEAYPEGVTFLEKRGFKKVYTALAMDGSIWPTLKHPEKVEEIEEKLRKDGIEVKPLETKYIWKFLKFLRENFSADWYRHSLEMLQRGCEKDQIMVAVKDEEVIGYCQHYNGEGYDWYKPGEHFGPFGVKEEYRGKGIGTILFYKIMQRMRQRNIHHTFVVWTDEEASHLYSRFGMQVSRRFAVMKKLFG